MSAMSVEQQYLLNRMNNTANRLQLGTLLAGLLPLEASGTLTQAQIVAMKNTPATLIAAPGAGKVLVVESIQVKHVYATAAYTGGGVVTVQYGDGTALVAAAATLVTAASSEERLIVPTVAQLDASTGTGKGFSVTAPANQALQITNATAVFAAGNAANVLKYLIRYKVLPLIT